MFEWDPRKARANADKHGVTFDDAVTVFVDPNALDGPDLAHSAAEARYLLYVLAHVRDRKKLGRIVRPSAVYDGHRPRKPELVAGYDDLAVAV